MIRTLALILALATSPALAEKIAVFVPQPGGGVVERIGNVSPQEAAIALGLDAPPAGATGLILEEGALPRWTDRTPRQINEDHGGEGRPVIEPFNEAQVGGTPSLPLSGTWRATLVSRDTGACPAEMVAAVQGGAVAQDGATVQLNATAPFTPAQMIPELSWTATGANRWRGTMPNQAASPIVVAFDVTLASPSRIDLEQTIDVSRVHPGCRVFTVARYDHAG
ncbi:MAG: hypothetical protein ACU0BF_11835 [Paracoccaceae bacterium]